MVGVDLLGNVLNNDDANGDDASISNVNITIVTAANPIYEDAPVPVLDPATGVVSVPAGTPSGDYEIEYQICLKSTPTPVCDVAVVTVSVRNSIDADDNVYTNQQAGNTTPSIFDNDLLGGVAFTENQVTVSLIDPPAGFTVNPDGTINIDESVISGTYNIDYKLCERNVTPENCDIATVTIQIQNIITAENDTIVVAPGATEIEIVINDSINGVPITDPSKIVVSPGTDFPAGFTLSPDGKLTIDPSVPAGEYLLNYQICEADVIPENCAEAFIVLNIESPAYVSMAYFNVQELNGNGYLTWATALEQDNKGFEVQKSNDGRAWKNIGFVSTKAPFGNSSIVTKYDFTDEQLQAGTTYYRLRQIDIFGQSTYTEVKHITVLKENSAIKVYPNPFKDVVNIKGTEAHDLVVIVDMMGREVYRIQATNNTLEVDMSKLSEGIYYLSIISNKGDVKVAYKLVKSAH